MTLKYIIEIIKIHKFIKSFGLVRKSIFMKSFFKKIKQLTVESNV